MLIENPRNEYIKLINNAKKENRKKEKNILKSIIFYQKVCLKNGNIEKEI